MRVVGSAQIHALLPADTGTGLDTASHGQDRRSVSGGSLQRQPPDGGLSGQRRDSDQPRSGAKPHAAHGITGDLTEATNHGSTRTVIAVSLSGGPPAGHGCGSGLCHQHHLHPAGEGISVPGGDRGSVLQKRAQLEALQQT